MKDANKTSEEQVFNDGPNGRSPQDSDVTFLSAARRWNFFREKAEGKRTVKCLISPQEYLTGISSGGLTGADPPWPTKQKKVGGA